MGVKFFGSKLKSRKIQQNKNIPIKDSSFPFVSVSKKMNKKTVIVPFRPVGYATTVTKNNRSMAEVKGIHKGQDVWIVGKGRSLEFIRKDHFGEGVIITLNQAIIAIESLCLPNFVYSSQKDGGIKTKGRKNQALKLPGLSPECNFSHQCGDVCGPLVRPKRATLLLHSLESKYCFSSYIDRVVFDLRTLGLQSNVYSAVFVVKIALYLGCCKFHFLCFDSSTQNDNRAFIPGEGIDSRASYGNQRPFIEQFIPNIVSEWKTPTESGGLI